MFLIRRWPPGLKAADAIPWANEPFGFNTRKMKGGRLAAGAVHMAGLHQIGVDVIRVSREVVAIAHLMQAPE